MRRLLLEFKKEFKDIRSNWRTRVANILTFVALFTIIGVGIPYAYYRYFDTKQYINIDLVIYDKKVFQRCEPFVSNTHYTALLDLPIQFQMQVFRIYPDGKKEPVRGTRSAVDYFVNDTPPQGTTLTNSGIVPAFPDGTYYQEGLVSYKVRGHERTAPYRGTIVTIEGGPDTCPPVEREGEREGPENENNPPFRENHEDIQ